MLLWTPPGIVRLARSRWRRDSSNVSPADDSAGATGRTSVDIAASSTSLARQRYWAGIPFAAEEIDDEPSQTPMTIPHEPAFEAAEYGARLAAVRRGMAERELDALLVFGPHNVFYLSGMDSENLFDF